MMCEAAPFCSFRRNWLLAFIMSASLCVKSSCQQERILIDTVHVGNKWHLITQNLNLSHLLSFEETNQGQNFRKTSNFPMLIPELICL